MFSQVLISLTLSFLSVNASADDSQCTPFLLKNITDETQSSIIITLLNNAKSLIDDAKKYTSIKTRCYVAETTCDKPIDCAGVKEKNPLAPSGVYKIWIRNRVVSGQVEVYCDMEDNGGAWTVIQRRGDFDSGKDYFYRDWQSYKKGFGNPVKDFWLGNDNIFALTNQRSNLVKFTLTDWKNNKTYATYDEFWIDDEYHKYTMHVSGYRGTAGDSFFNTNGIPFTTKDQDNDKYEKNCAVQFTGAWWYTNCHYSNLNGFYFQKVHASQHRGVEWSTFRGQNYSLKDTVIKIRPIEYQEQQDEVTPA